MPRMSSPYRILSLDGGGRWSLISVMALQRIFGEQARGHDVLKNFDLVAANSGGSIVLGALAENMSLDELLDLFCTSGALFPPELFVVRPPLSLVHAAVFPRWAKVRHPEEARATDCAAAEVRL